MATEPAIPFEFFPVPRETEPPSANRSASLDAVTATSEPAVTVTALAMYARVSGLMLLSDTSAEMPRPNLPPDLAPVAAGPPDASWVLPAGAGASGASDWTAPTREAETIRPLAVADTVTSPPVAVTLPGVAARELFPSPT